MATITNLSALTEYVNVHRDELYTKATLGAKSLDYIDILPNVKYKDQINFLDSTVELQDGSECGFNPNGSDIFSERYVETVAVKVEKSWCWKDFEKTFANYQLNWEAGREKLPFEEKIAENQMAAIQEKVEDLVWQGDATLGISGLIADIKAETGSVISFETGQTVSAKIDAMVAAASVKMLKKGVNLFISMTDFRNYIQEQNGACCNNKPVLDAASDSISYFGDSRVKIIPVIGLEGTGAMVLATADALVWATDIEGSENVYRLWYDEKDDMFDFRVLFRAGTAVRFPDMAILGQ